MRLANLFVRFLFHAGVHGAWVGKLSFWGDPQPLISNPELQPRSRSFPTFDELHVQIFKAYPNETHAVMAFSNPYNLQPDFSYPHSNLRHFFLCDLMFGCHPSALCKPHFIVEVGSFHGQSAIAMALALDEFRFERVPILCIDPFTGDLNVRSKFATDSKLKDWANMQDSRILIFDQFMVNVQSAIKSGLVNRGHILPFQVTSMVGARWLDYLGYSPDLIFIDSAHEAHETFLEIGIYFRVLTPGGIIFGDDFDWPHVKHDVQKFVEKCNEMFSPNGSRELCRFWLKPQHPESRLLFWLIQKRAR